MSIKKSIVTLRSRLLLFFAAALLPAADSAALDQWVWRNPQPQGNDLNTVLWTGDQLIAAGNYGTLMTSVDGHDWVLQPPPVPTAIRTLQQKDGELLGLSDGGVFLRSADGHEWRRVSAIERQGDREIYLYGLAWSPERFVAVGYDATAEEGIITTSTDGVRWSRVEPEGLQHLVLREVIFTGERFLAAGGEPGSRTTSPGIIATSSDGINWSVTRPDFPGTFTTITSTPHGIVGAGSRSDGFRLTNFIAFSEDGETWGDDRALESQHGPVRLRWADETLAFVATSSAGALHYRNGYWEEQEVQWLYPESLRDLTWNGERWIAVGEFGVLFSAAQASEWERIGEPPHFSDDFLDVVWGGDRFVAVGRDGLAAVSVDGANWTKGYVPHHEHIYSGRDLCAVVWTGERFYAFSTYGSTFSSDDGLVWNVIAHRKVGVLRAFWTGSETLVVAMGRLGTFGLLTVSGSGWGWPSLSIYPRVIMDLVWTGERVIGIAQNEYGGTDNLCAAIRLPDGSWVVHELGIFGSVSGIGWNGSEVLALLASEGKLLAARSPDGLEWTLAPVEWNFQPRSPWHITGPPFWQGGEWVLPIVERAGTESRQAALLTSSNGVEWDRTEIPLPHLGRLAASEDLLVSVGSRGSIVTSGDEPDASSHRLLTGGLPGSIVAEPSKPSYEPGTEVQLTVHPPSGFQFVEWVGDLSGSATTQMLVMDSTKSVSARFRLPAATPDYHFWVDGLHEPDGQRITPFGDYSGDGVPNLLKYAGDLPISDSSGRSTGEVIRTDHSGVTFQAKLREDIELTYFIEYSDDLTGWTHVPLLRKDGAGWTFDDAAGRIDVSMWRTGSNEWTFLHISVRGVEDAHPPRFYRLRVGVPEADVSLPLGP